MNKNEKPILFKTEMVQAILAERKTQTRRIIKPQPGKEIVYLSPMRLSRHPFGCVGDVMWVRETWSPLQDIKACAVAGEHCEIVYRADDGWIENEPESKETLLDGKWKPSIFMPRWASRINLEITNIRVDRLQEIDAADCYREGIIEPLPYVNFDVVEKFKFLWDSINSKRGYPWESNPWVFVIEFKKICKGGD